MSQSLVLYFHILTGTIAVLAGYIALFSKKGQSQHIKAGNWYVVTMILMAISGAVVAYLKPMDISVIAGIFSGYLVVSGVAVFRYANERKGTLNVLLSLLTLATGSYSLYCVYLVEQSGVGHYQGFAAEPYWMFAILPLLSFMFDLKYMLATNISYTSRLTRHIWRMCFAMFIAVGSFVGQGLQSMPEAVKSFVLVEYADLIILLIMLYWIIRSRRIFPRIKNKLLGLG